MDFCGLTSSLTFVAHLQQPVFSSGTYLMPITVISENKDHWEQILFLPGNRILHCCRSRRILLIHKAHQSMFHTMQAMCILYTSHSAQAEIAVAYPPLKLKKKKILKKQWFSFLEFWKKYIFKAKVLLFRLNLGIEISIILKIVGGFYTWSLVLYLSQI